jgi:ribosomal protein S6--L-glutamate ligase
MRVGILGWERWEAESKDLLATGLDLGHDVTLFVLDDVTCDLAPGAAVPRIRGEPLATYDVILSRAQVRAGHTQFDYERYALLDGVDGVTVLDPADVYLAAESKFIGLRRLAAAGLPVALTRSCASVADVRRALDEWGHVVVKPSFGLGGTDVEQVRDLRQDGPVVDRLLASYGHLVCQPYLPHPDGDVRVTMVGPHAPLVANRVPAPSNWRANVAQGATARPLDPDPYLVEISRRAAEVMAVTVAALDFLPSEDGYRIVEFNNTPCWCFASDDTRRHVTETIYEVAETRHRSRTAPGLARGA